jgi:hypothetical protein
MVVNSYIADQRSMLFTTKKYDKQDRQGKAAFNERSPHQSHKNAKIRTFISKIVSCQKNKAECL